MFHADKDVRFGQSDNPIDNFSQFFSGKFEDHVIPTTEWKILVEG